MGTRTGRSAQRGRGKQAKNRAPRRPGGLHTCTGAGKGTPAGVSRQAVTVTEELSWLLMSCTV